MRSKKVLLVSHCILNQNSVVEPLARAKGAFSFAKELIESGIGIIQLPCPEFRYLGITRNPMGKAEYDTPEYRELCRKLFAPIAEDLLIYLNNGYEFCGIIGINQSPTCSITGRRGILMEEVFSMLASNGIYPKYLEIPEDYNDSSYDDFIVKVKNFLDN
jgi:predicted secreted protein